MKPEESIEILESVKFMLDNKDYSDRVEKAINEAIEALKERPRGEWIPNTRYNRKNKRFYDCSICHYGEKGEIICEVAKIPLFCPNCGAQMYDPED